MALVKIVAGNIFAGADFQKLEVGAVYNVNDDLARNWIASGKAELSNDESGVLIFEVATPAVANSGDGLSAELVSAKHLIAELEDKNAQLPVLAGELAEANEKVAALTAELEDKNAQLAAVTAELKALKDSKKAK
ncbi:hypothetical protein [Morganella psychrotolerans]|uniref:Uncharacterized protein n=1 Tax=Morganella psychrotolerans TaxID=368603 RepID=A0A1B8HQE4_9GAMM|nr:hypothetical protein [Morganella psychrotolerans]OBU11696.1 hypothetical protein AYY17_03055 [Morganella psychrotolerans]